MLSGTDVSSLHAFPCQFLHLSHFLWPNESFDFWWTVRISIDRWCMNEKRKEKFQIFFSISGDFINDMGNLELRRFNLAAILEETWNLNFRSILSLSLIILTQGSPKKLNCSKLDEFWPFLLRLSWIWDKNLKLN